MKNFNKKLPCKHCIAATWNRYSFPETLLEISLTSLMKGSFLISKSVLFWYFWISFKLFVPCVVYFLFGGDFLRLILEMKKFLFFFLKIFYQTEFFSMKSETFEVRSRDHQRIKISDFEIVSPTTKISSQNFRNGMKRQFISNFDFFSLKWRSYSFVLKFFNKFF